VKSGIYDTLEIVQAVVDAVAPEAEGVSEVIGLVAALDGAANDLTTDSGGALEDQLQTTVTNLGTQAADGFGASLTGLDETFNYIFSDWRRLSAVAGGIVNQPGQWDVAANEGQAVTAMTNAATIGYYRALIPLVYSAEVGQALPSPDPAKWCAPDTVCELVGGIHGSYMLGSSAYSYPANDAAHGFAPGYNMVIVGKTPLFDATTLGIGIPNDPFPPTLMSDVTSKGYYYPGWFFQRFPFARIICPPSPDSDPSTCTRP
jgi:hypothetical protein